MKTSPRSQSLVQTSTFAGFGKLLAGVCLLVQTSQAANLYWDTNNSAIYSGGATPAGTWDGATPNWSTNANGLPGTNGAYVTGSDVFFSSGTDATGAYNVTLGSSQTVNSINFHEGHVTIDPLTPPVTGPTGSDGTQVITFAGATPGINVQNMDSTIKTRINASTAGFTKTGIGKLTLDFGAANINSYFNVGTQTITINGGTIQMAGTAGTAGANQLSNTAFNLVINSGGAFNWGNIANSVSDSAVFTINTGGTLFVTTSDQIRSIAGSGQIVNTSTLNLSLSGTQTFSGLITGTGSLGINSASGTLTLTNANTFSGATNANTTGAATQGLVLGHKRALQNSTLTPTTTTTAGTTVRFGVLADKNFIVGGLAALSNQASLNSLLLQDTGGSAITLHAGNNDGISTFAGVLTGTGGLTKIGTGTLTLTGHYNTSSTAYTANSYTGDTTVNAGSRNAVGGGPVNSGTAGTLKLDFSVAGAPAANIINPASRLVLGGGRLLLTGNNAVAASQTFSGTKLNVGRSYVTVTLGTGSNNAVVNLGNITRDIGSIIEFTLPTGAQNAANGILTSKANTNGILGGWATIGTNWAMNSGGNVVAYDKAANYTLHATGNLVNDAMTNVEITNSSIAISTAAGTTDINTLMVNDSAARTIEIEAGETLRVGKEGGIWNQGAGTLTIGTAANVGTLTAGGGAGSSGELIVNTSGGEVFINSSITDNGVGNAVTLVKTGPTNQLTLSGTNTYTGGTIVTQGRLRIQSNASIGSGTVTVMPGGQAWLNSSAVFSNNFVISGTGWGEGTSGVGPGAIRLANGATLGTSASTVTLAGDARIGGNTTTGTIAAKITGDYGIDFASGGSAGAGPSTFTITNAGNDFSGNLSLNSIPGSGSSITSYTAFNASPVTVKLGASEVIPNGLEKGNVILTGGATGSVVTLDLNGFNETINGLVSQGTAANTFVTNSVAGQSTLTLGDNNTIAAFGGIIKDGVGQVWVTKIGEGAQTFSGANTYSGDTRINKGVLRAGLANTFSANSAVILANDATAMLDLNDFSQTIGSVEGSGTINLGTSAAADTVATPVTRLTTGGNNRSTVYSGLIAGAGGINKTGSGTFALSGAANSYVGTTTVSQGNLQVGVSSVGRSGSGYTNVAGGAVLSGSGIVQGATIINGTLRAGDVGGSSIGKLTFADLTTSSLTLAGGGSSASPRAEFTLAGATGNEANPADGIQTAGFLNGTFGNHDAIEVQGTLNLNAGSTIKVILDSGYNPTYGDVFNLFDWGTVSGGTGAIVANGFDPLLATDLDLQLSATMIANGWTWGRDQFLSSGIIYVIPEPSRALLMLVGTFGLLMRRKRREA